MSQKEADEIFSLKISLKSDIMKGKISGCMNGLNNT